MVETMFTLMMPSVKKTRLRVARLPGDQTNCLTDLVWKQPLGTVLALVCGSAALTAETGRLVLWQADALAAKLIAPRLEPPVEKLAETTINGYLADCFGRELPLARNAAGPGPFIVVGDETNNPVIERLVSGGLKLNRQATGAEGFRILTHEAGERRFVVITANSAAGLKHGCQELVFFRLAASAERGEVDWPLDVTMKPVFPYRGVYMLPCWSAQDSIENWQRVLKFHSELTLNRNWFWLAGFPLLPSYGGEYTNTALAEVRNVRGLVRLCREEAMKFYIGGGWYNWHHAKVIGGSVERGIQYYVDLVKLLPGTEGIYLEPAGEGSDIDPNLWRQRAEALQTLAERVRQDDPDFEFAIAIGKFNAPAYREAVHRIDDRHTYWWWCWGDPLRQNALAEHPLVLRWHTVVQMSDFHGSIDPPLPSERPLTGFATSYDPGMGYGNPWNGWGKLGYDKPRNFHPHTLPYFSHQYRFREGCWDPGITDAQFTARLARRLFDADMPADSVANYQQLSRLCFRPLEAKGEVIDSLDAFVSAHAGKGSARNRDTLARMREALDGLRLTLEKERTRSSNGPAK